MAHCEQIELDIAPYPFVKYNFSDRCHYPNTRISTFEDIYFLKEYIKCITNFQKNAEKARIEAWIKHLKYVFLDLCSGWLLTVLPLTQYKMKKKTGLTN